MEWVCGSLCTIMFIPALIWVIRARIAHVAEVAKLEREGRVVKAWIVVANDQLYKPNSRSARHLAQLVFILGDLEPLPDLETKLAKIAERIRSIELVDQHDWEERYLCRVMSTHIPYGGLLRVPVRLTDGLTAYSTSKYIRCDYLPGGQLTKPYVFVKAFAYADPKDRYSEMVPYPDEEQEA